MSYQVGAACYATVVDAGGAACAAYAPVSTLVHDGAAVRTVSCTSADPSTGALNLQISTIAVDGSPGTVSTVSQSIAFPPCMQADYVIAAEDIISALLVAWVTIWAAKEVRKYIDWSRGDPQ